MIADFLSYCDESDYLNFQDVDGYFVVVIDEFFKENKIQKEVSKHLSKKFEISDFKSEVLHMESQLHTSDIMTDEILPF